MGNKGDWNEAVNRKRPANFVVFMVLEPLFLPANVRGEYN